MLYTGPSFSVARAPRLIGSLPLFNPATYQSVTAGAGPYDPASVFDTNTTAGNIAIVPKFWDSGVALVLDAATGIPYVATPTIGRQHFQWKEYNPTTHAYVTVTDAVDGRTADYYRNNSLPLQTVIIPAQQAYTNIPYEGPILDDIASELDGDQITWSIQSGSFANIAIVDQVQNAGQVNERTVKRPIGTPQPGMQVSSSIVIRATDSLGQYTDFAAFSFNVGTGVQIPTFTEGDSGESVLQALQALENVLAITYRYTDDTFVPFNGFISITPSSATYVAPGSQVSVLLSGVPQGVPVDPLPTLITVQATAKGFYQGYLREIGESFDIRHPEEFSPYWMSFLEAVPTDWLPFIEVYDQQADYARVLWPGRDETRLNAPGSGVPS